jgi:YjbE family integral membrane protein
MESFVQFLEIFFINILLSGDNAVVIAMASQKLPLQQRKQAIIWGSGLAVGLRCLLTVVAAGLLQFPYIQAIGSVFLFIIAVRLIVDGQGGEEPHIKAHQIRTGATLGQAIRTILAADFIMSLDNVLAIAAVAEGEIILMLLGIAISIPMIIWGSQLLSRLLQRFPSLIYFGGGLLGYAAGKMLTEDPAAAKLGLAESSWLIPFVPLFAVPLVIVIASLIARKKR